MVWHASLHIDYDLEAGRTVSRHVHTGPLRILQSLYPEGQGICHNVLVHPPGGLVGGDTLAIKLHCKAGTHALVTTPGATRFYRSDGLRALQHSTLNLAGNARLEWLPLEAICYSGCQAENRLNIDIAPDAELLGWDLTAFGLPQAQQPFTHGEFLQHISVQDRWLERGMINAADQRLLHSPAGMDGHSCMATLFFIGGQAIGKSRKQMAIDAAREIVAGYSLLPTAGVTSPHPQVVLVRVLAPLVEPAMGLLRLVRNQWRESLWSVPAISPRIWSM